MNWQSERPPRRGYRFPAGVQAELHEPNGTFPCAAENLSRTGVLLVGPLPVPTQERVDLTLKDHHGSYNARLTGKVVRVFPAEGSTDVRLAIEFVDLDAAHRDELEVLLARLLENGPQGGNPMDALKPGATPLEIKRALEAIPLPQRLNMAGRAAQREREFLRLDSHPAVLDSLARNPSLVLADARALAASPFLSPTTIDTLAMDQRFAGDQELVIALASHPRVSPQTAEKLTGPLQRPQIKLLLAKPSLGGALRQNLVKRLTRG